MSITPAKSPALQRLDRVGDAFVAALCLLLLIAVFAIAILPMLWPVYELIQQTLGAP